MIYAACAIDDFVVWHAGPLVAGSFLLGRLGELLLVVQVLESGWGFHRVAVKGLELQETSCHALEAAKAFHFVSFA